MKTLTGLGFWVDVNHGNAYSGRGRPDLTVGAGVYVGIEVKKSNGTYSPKQRLRIRQIRATGNIAFGVRSVAEAVNGVRLAQAGRFPMTQPGDPIELSLEALLNEGAVLPQEVPDAPAAQPAPDPDVEANTRVKAAMEQREQDLAAARVAQKRAARIAGEPVPPTPMDPETARQHVIDDLNAILGERGPIKLYNHKDGQEVQIPFPGSMEMIIFQLAVVSTELRKLNNGLRSIEDVLLASLGARRIGSPAATSDSPEHISAQAAESPTTAEAPTPEKNEPVPVKRTRRTKAELDAARSAAAAATAGVLPTVPAVAVQGGDGPGESPALAEQAPPTPVADTAAATQTSLDAELASLEDLLKQIS